MVMKRAFDLLVSLGLIVCLSPVLAVLAILIRVRLGAPILFSQMRPGRDGRPFRMIKFRSMTNETDAAGNLLPDSVRLTAFGKWLRSSSLDELPELLNVLHGDMSLVGPRPLLLDYLPLYSEWQARRHEVRPGITGWAQVNGRNALDWPAKFELDVWYVDNRSFLLDLRILADTVRKVIVRDGVSADGHATMPAFTGNAPGGPSAGRGTCEDAASAQ